MVMLLFGSAARKNGLHGDHQTAGGPGLHRASFCDSGQSAAEDGGRRLFCFALQSRRCDRGIAAQPPDFSWSPAAENSRCPPLRGRSANGLIAVLKAELRRHAGKRGSP
jgi:hypothetical protein